MKKSIVIVDDHTLIAQAIKSIISNFEAFEVLYVCENGADLIEKLNQNKKNPDIILLDISMPIMNGFETAKWLNENKPDVLIMALSMQNDEESVIKMIKNGAHGYLLKNSHPADLEKALLSLIDVGFYYPDWASKIVFKNMKQQDKVVKSEFKITDREKEFLKFNEENNLKNIISSYNINDPAASVPSLVKLYQQINALPSSNWKSFL